MKRKATIYRRGDRILVNRVDTTTDGIPIVTSEVYAFDKPFDELELGASLRAVVAAARAGVPPPKRDDWDRLSDALYQAADVRSWRTFVRGTRTVSVWEGANQIRLLPSVNEGAKLGWLGMPEREIRIQNPDDAELGRQMLESIARAEVPGD